MREVFGDVRLVRTAADDGFAVDAPGLCRPVPLIALCDGRPMPDLTELLGRTVGVTALINTYPGNVETLGLLVTDLFTVETPPGPLWCALSGNIGKAPEQNPDSNRVKAHLAFAKHAGTETCWMRLTAYKHFSISDQLINLTSGAGICCYGQVETYDYKDKPRLQVALRGFSLLRSGSGAPPAPENLARSRTAESIAPLDAFTSIEL